MKPELAILNQLNFEELERLLQEAFSDRDADVKVPNHVALKQKYLVEYQKRYGDGTMNPQYLRDGVLNPKWKSFERWLKESGINIGGGASQGEAGIPGERPPIGSVITPR